MWTYPWGQPQKQPPNTQFNYSLDTFTYTLNIEQT